MTSAEGNIREANRFAARLLCVPRRGLLGRQLTQFVLPEQRPAFRSKLARLREGGRPRVREWEVRLQPRGKAPIETAVAILPVGTAYRRPARLVCAVRNITRRKRVEQRLKESERQHRALYRRILEHRDALRVLSTRYLRAREEEAQRIAHQLHDEAGQVTASIHLALAEVARDLPESGLDRLKVVAGYLDEMEDRLRRLSHELRPTILDDLGLAPALEFLAEGFSSRTGIPIRVEGSTEGRLDPAIETTIYRVVQEALANIGRHSRAAAATIRLSRERGSLRCVIRDNGVGFETVRFRAEGRRRGLGLLGIRERLDAVRGRVLIRSNPGEGTEISVAVPLGRPS